MNKQEGKSKKVKGKSKNQDRSSPEQFFMPENFYSPAYVMYLWEKAQEFNGDYDGWETFIVKD